MSYPRIYNAAVDMVDRNVAEGRGAKTAFIDPGETLNPRTLLLPLSNTHTLPVRSTVGAPQKRRRGHGRGGTRAGGGRVLAPLRLAVATQRMLERVEA